jgi:uncharacterized protein YciI
MRRRHLPALLLPLLLPLSLGVSAAATTSTWFIFLESGRKTPDDKEAVQAMQRGHIANFQRLFGLGQLMGAGPMRDPSGKKRGIVVAQAPSREELNGLFQPDEYVREGYMTLNAAPARVNKGLNTTGIEPSSIVEGRIVMIGRDAVAPTAEMQKARSAMLQALVDRGVFGAWYTLESGSLAEVLIARGTDSEALRATLADYPGLSGVSLEIWGQWLSKGVVS